MIRIEATPSVLRPSIKSSKTPMFYLQNVSAGYLGNAPLFWRKGGSGYTADIDDLQEFDEAEADQIIRSTQGTHKFVKWPVEAVLASVQKVVDMQKLRRL